MNPVGLLDRSASVQLNTQTQHLQELETTDPCAVLISAQLHGLSGGFQPLARVGVRNAQRQAVKACCIDDDRRAIELEVDAAHLVGIDGAEPVQRHAAGQCIERHLLEKARCVSCLLHHFRTQTFGQSGITRQAAEVEVNTGVQQVLG